MPWAYIYALLGRGLHWGRSQAEFRNAIRRAEQDGRPDAAEHLRIMLRSRNAVMMEDEEKEPSPREE
jgi:hypothetical protein